ncbi:MAG: hypothetical protein H7A09_10290 [Oceanospirillaceae bacterium]|nr:hypothetical protein [Oceanospirillaceae bacterium]MCP5351241.1 hypothetical protein [Oceanospirillaceae bacterium]
MHPETQKEQAAKQYTLELFRAGKEREAYEYYLASGFARHEEMGFEEFCQRARGEWQSPLNPKKLIVRSLSMVAVIFVIAYLSGLINF